MHSLVGNLSQQQSAGRPPRLGLLHFNWLCWIAVARGLLSIYVAHTVRMNDPGAPSPLAPGAESRLTTPEGLMDTVGLPGTPECGHGLLRGRMVRGFS